jgi:hypothetical protein
VNSRTLFVPFTVTPPRLVGPDQSPIFEPAAPCLKITTSSLPPGESCQLASGPSDESFVLNLRSNLSSVQPQLYCCGQLTSDHPKLRLIGTVPIKANRRRADRG